MAKEDKNQKLVREIMQRPENKNCFDCGEKVRGFQQISITLPSVVPAALSPLLLRQSASLAPFLSLADASSFPHPS